jgi:diaminopimelate decarboxylase
MQDHAEGLLRQHFPNCKEELIVGGRPLTELVKSHRTPFFAYSRGVAKKNLIRLRAALNDFDVLYSVKANPNVAWLEFFVSQKCGLSVATEGELNLALSAGCLPERIVLAGAGKTEADLISGVKARVSEIHAESGRELNALKQVASIDKHPVKIVLRVNAGEISRLRDGSFAVQRKAAAYGFDEESVGEAIELIRKSGRLAFYGIHTYYGTQHLDSDRLLSAYKYNVDLARRICRETGVQPRTIDFGGGFGIPYYVGEASFRMKEFGDELRSLLHQARDDLNLTSARLSVEPGRYLVDEAGLYVTRVIGTKTSSEKKFVVIDGGVHHHFAASGRLGGPVRKNFPVAVGNRLGEQTREIVTVMGRQCNLLDTLVRDVALPKVVVGHVLVFPQSGAYTLSLSPQLFRSHPKATEIFLE